MIKYIKGKDELPRKKKKAMKKRMLLALEYWDNKSIHFVGVNDYLPSFKDKSL